MAERFENSNKEYRYEESLQQEQSHQEHGGKEVRTITTDELKSITNIYYDCLERIFDFLDLNDLLMVANTCKRLQIAAAAKFSDEYGKRHILLYPFINDERYVGMFLANGDEINVNGLKYCLPFLRCFGGKLSDLRVNYGMQQPENGNLNRYISQYINQYCADTLISIDLRSTHPYIHAFQKPFKHVQRVEVSWWNFEGDQMAILADFFPNVRDLVLSSYFVHSETAWTNTYFPYLEHLELAVFSITSGTSMGLTYENVVNLLHANQQLKSLQIHSDIVLSISTLLHVIYQNSSITKLTVTGSDRPKDVSMDELNRFLTEHPLMTELQLKCYCLATDGAIDLVRRMKSLKRFEFQVKDRHECDRFVNQLDNKWKSEISTGDDGFYINLSR